MTAQLQALQRIAPEAEAGNGDLFAIVRDGLRRRPKRLPSKLFYDHRGSELFEQICATPEYYLTRAELLLMRQHAQSIASTLGPDVLLVEYGSGSGLKTRLLLSSMERPNAYVPVELSQEALLASVAILAESLPRLAVVPLCADFTQPLAALPKRPGARRTVIYFPGSTIGNLDSFEAVKLLRQMRSQMGAAGAALIGFDLKKDPAVIEAAYNDAAGLTAEFTLNLLLRLNRELHANFNLANFRHRALYNPAAGRIETYILSLRDQRVRVADESIHFAQGEEMLVEISCKYSEQDFALLADRAGLRVERSWCDNLAQFCVQYLVPR
jgi:dimethylhistidine N-methyltransferase